MAASLKKHNRAHPIRFSVRCRPAAQRRRQRNGDGPQHARLAKAPRARFFFHGAFAKYSAPFGYLRRFCSDQVVIGRAGKLRKLQRVTSWPVCRLQFAARHHSSQSSGLPRPACSIKPRAAVSSTAPIGLPDVVQAPFGSLSARATSDAWSMTFPSMSLNTTSE